MEKLLFKTALTVVLAVLAALFFFGKQEKNMAGEAAPTLQVAVLPEIHPINSSFMLDGVKWRVKFAHQLKQKTLSTFGNRARWRTSGKFIKVHFSVQSDSFRTIARDSFTLRDSLQRTFVQPLKAADFIDDAYQCTESELNPGVLKDCQAIFEVAEDAKGFLLVVDNLEQEARVEGFVRLEIVQ